VVLLEPSALSSDSIEIACAGHTAEQSLHAMHRSSPLSYLIRANFPLNLGDKGVFTSGYWTVTLRLKKAFSVTIKPFIKSINVSFLIN
jgi:hypothetical protein